MTTEMQVTETLSDGLRRAYDVVIPAAEIESRRAARLAELARTIRLPGFRPGKVPANILKQRYGAAIAAEVLEESVTQATDAMLSERGIRPASQPKVELGDGFASPIAVADLSFKVELEVLPDVVPPNLSDITLTRVRAEVPAETVDKALAEIAGRNRDLVPVEEPRGAAIGEVLTVDYLGRVDGVAFPGGTGSDTNVEIGGQGFIPGFSEQMEGLSPGETRTITVTFPADYGARELAGKEATFEITAKALLRPVVPELNDALAEKIGFDGIQEVRDVVTRQMQREYDQLSRLRIKRQLLDALADRADFAAPQGMVDAEFAQIWQRLESERAQGGQPDAGDAGKDDDTLRAEYRAIAERRVRLGLLLSEIGRQNAITVGQDELARAMRTEAGRYQGQEQQVMEFFQKTPQAVESLRGPIFEDKVVDYVIELAQVTDQVVSPEELARDPDAETEALTASSAPAPVIETPAVHPSTEPSDESHAASAA